MHATGGVHFVLVSLLSFRVTSVEVFNVDVTAVPSWEIRTMRVPSKVFDTFASLHSVKERRTLFSALHRRATATISTANDVKHNNKNMTTTKTAC